MSTATAETTDIEDLLSDLSQLDSDVPCQCRHQAEPSGNGCREPAVANALLEFICKYEPHFWGRRGYVLMCKQHLDMARTAALKCGTCGTPGAYRLLKEIPL